MVWSLVLVFLSLFWSLSGISQAKIFHVSTAKELQAALNEARANGEDDTIYLAPGVYDVDTVSTEEQDCPPPEGDLRPIPLEGGYGLCYLTAEDENYSLRLIGAGPEETIITSSSRSKGLLFLASGRLNSEEVVLPQPKAHFSVEGIAFEGGRLIVPSDYGCAGAGGLTIITADANISVKNCLFEENEGRGTRRIAGGSSFVSFSGQLSLEDSVFRNNQAGSKGGAFLAVRQGEITVTRNSFENNRGYTGGLQLFLREGRAFVQGNNFLENQGFWGGGLGVYVTGHSDSEQSGSETEITLQDNLFQGNKAFYSENYPYSGQGGGMKLADHSVALRLVLERNRFEENYAERWGAGATLVGFSEGSSWKISRNTFQKNHLALSPQALENSPAGGGLYLYILPQVTMEQITIEENIFVKNFVEGEPGLNQKISGAGFFFFGKAQRFEINNNIFLENRLTGKASWLLGAGFFVSSRNIPKVEIKDNLFEKNKIEGEALEGGNAGGFWINLGYENSQLQKVGEVLIEGNQILYNEAFDSAGCFVNLNCNEEVVNQPSLYFRNNLVAKNYSEPQTTPGCYLGSIGSIYVTNNTFFANFQGETPGTALYFYPKSGAEAFIYNNIFWGSGLYFGAYGEGEGIIHLAKNLFSWEDIPEEWNDPAFEIRDNFFQIDPKFVDEESGDFHLSPDSPFVDRGDPSAPGLPEKDFEGDPRVIGSAPDLGFDEIVPGPRPSLKINGVHYPLILSSHDELSIAVSLNTAGITGQGDYFLWARIPGGACYCYAHPGIWNPCACDDPRPAYHGGLITFSDFPVAEVPCAWLPSGRYKVYFAVDIQMDGRVDPETIIDSILFWIED